MRHVLLVTCAVLAWSVVTFALPHTVHRREVSSLDDEPLESDLMDQIAEESEVHETVVSARPSRGNIKFNLSPEYKSTSVKTRVTLPPDDYVDEDVEDIKKAQKERDRSLMVVLPYDTKNLSETKIQELYTKKPLTWIINSTSTVAPPTETPTERTSTTVVVTPTSEVVWRPVTPGPTTLPPPVIRDEVRELLASIGLFPAEPSTTTTQAPNFNVAADNMTPEMKKLLGSLGLLNSESGNEIPQTKIVETTPAPQEPAALHAEIDPASYSAFKPIPFRKQEVRGDMQDFLASFGLVDHGNNRRVPPSTYRPRNKKSDDRDKSSPATPAPTNIPTLHPESMNDEMKEILHSLGLAPNVNPEEFNNKQVAQSRSISASIFSPTASVQNGLNNTEDVETLKTLLTTYKLLSKNASSPEELEEQLQTATQYLSKHDLSHLNPERPPSSPTLDKLLDSPDPLSTEELLVALNEAKNSVYKRQQTTTTEATEFLTDEITTTTKKATTTEDKAEHKTEETTSEVTSTDKSTDNDSEGTDTTSSNSASIADLESSFGGSTGDSETTDESLPPAKPNGFYFLLDWNSFLNVGEDDKGVNLKFAPRAGNSRHFLPITVP